MAKDPVCGMDVDPASAQQKSEHEGQTYYFCAPGCRRAFESDPKKYLDPNYKASM
jgi:Cu+-exporting ATPase